MPPPEHPNARDLPALLVESGCAPLRTRLGPTAWMVLEELLLRADSSGVVVGGVRHLAVGIGLDKDTMARALRRLRDEDVVSAEGPGRYRVDLTACHGISLLAAGDSPPAPRPAPRIAKPRRQAGRRATTEQGSLFDAAGT